MTYNPAPVLYRRAMVVSQQAAEIAAGTRPVTVNPVARIGDACIVAITLSHAAVETAWFHAQADVGLDPLEWPRKFEKGLAEVAATTGRQDFPALPPTLRERFERIAAWRNYLVHGDPSSTQRLRALGEKTDPSELTPELAAEAVAVAREALSYIGLATGQDLGTTNWRDPLE
jgi:hypothetical protein